MVTEKFLKEGGMRVCELLLFFDSGLFEYLIHQNRNMFAKVIISV